MVTVRCVAKFLPGHWAPDEFVFVSEGQVLASHEGQFLSAGVLRVLQASHSCLLNTSTQCFPFQLLVERVSCGWLKGYAEFWSFLSH
jgi:hypothetical protein